jgi:subtilisin family serine protease
LTAFAIRLCAALALAAAALPAAAHARTAPSADGRYIVVYDADAESVKAETDARERRDGFDARYRYRHALKGFAAKLSPKQVERLRADAEIATVTPDYPVSAVGSVPLAAGEQAPPAGVRRIEAATTSSTRQASSAGVAVIDTGIDLAHPDLNAVDGVNCVNPGSPARDDNGHGTHVAGTIAARNNGSGVVGVAPGTKLFAVKVLNGAGDGTQSSVICGIEWVTANAAAQNIKVANMSLGGAGARLGTCPTTTDPQHKAFCDSTAAGVTYAVAAGNSGWDFDYAPVPDVPAAYPEALTVTAITDSDGAPGARGVAPACDPGERDDRYASYSNYASTSAGQAHTIAAPGTCVTSTWPGGGYDTISGTSMATPHVAGAVALCLGEAGASGPCTGLTPAQIAQRMRSDAQSRTSTTPSYGFTGDPLHSPVAGRYYGYLDWSGIPGAPPPPVTTTSKAPAAATIQSGSLRSGSASALATADGSYYRVNSTTSSTRTSAWYGSFSAVPSTLKNLRVTYQGSNSRSCTQTVAIYNWRTGVWATLSSRTVGTTETRIADLAPSGTLADYVSSGNLRVRVRCTTTAGSFYASANQLQIRYDA